jgi:hypothetical protein
MKMLKWSMPRINTELKMKSRGFSLWRKMEAERGRITLQTIADETGLNISTVRKFVADPDTEVGGAAIVGAVVLARYFGTTLDELLYVAGETSE